MSQAAPSTKATLSTRELSKFERLLGRQPDEAEQLKLCRLKDALGLTENDEVWTFVLALQHYEFLFERHPAAIQEALQRSTAGLQAAAEAAVKVEVSRVQGLLERAVASAAASVATARAETSRRLAWCWAGAGLSLFGAFSLVCGYELGRGGLPFWMRREIALEGGSIAKVAGAILGAPTGWAVMILVVPVCWTWLRRTLPVARDDELPLATRARAWGTIAGLAGAFALAATGVIWLVGSLLISPAFKKPAEKPSLVAYTPRPGVAATIGHGKDLTTPHIGE